jgi:predicted GIY-YIG superfamily endonuclease
MPVETKETKETKSYLCYILKSMTSNRTYIGSTNDFPHRIRQHNGQLVGGAKATHLDRPYKPICLVTGFSSQIEALQSEWRFKHPTGNPRKGASGIINKIKGLNIIFGDDCQDKMTSKTEKNITDMKLTINIDEDYRYLLKINKPNITIVGHNDVGTIDKPNILKKLNNNVNEIEQIIVVI